MYFVTDTLLWNYDFIKHEILDYIGETKDVVYKNKDHLLNVGYWNHILAKKPQISGNCIFHFSIGKRKIFNKNRESNMDTLVEVVKLLNPKAIIFCGDDQFEFTELNERLGDLTPLFMREHHCSSGRPMTIIPVGYHNGLGKGLTLKPSSDRKHVWSIVCDTKQLESESLHVMRTELDAGHVGPCMAEDARRIYNESIFVPVKRKKYAFDCSMIYDALSCGAIPIVVASQEDYKDHFGHFLGTDCIPPWVYNETWEGAAMVCKVIVDDPELLSEVQKNCIVWWQNILSIYRTVLDPLWEQ